ncbi:NAD-dependent epimerase/dehydratase family protein [Gammaproteobacteria bacterium]|nr:NAD-dependent epimerase/dehydratase family protein [Gammaproteobacteria bacterium]
MSKYLKIKKNLLLEPKKWLITGVAGFIGSNLLQELLELNQWVVGADNFSTGKEENLEDVKKQVTKKQWSRFDFYKGDISKKSFCKLICKDIDYVLHQAALGSVPRSLKDPLKTNNSNVTGFLSMLVAARDSNVKNFVYAASSSTYGDHKALPKKEDRIGKPLSPYAITKYVNELYAEIFFKSYQFNSIGLRYFNVFGKRQSPNGAYAAVIPRWLYAITNNKNVYINGDGTTSRDFCYVENAVQANILAATSNNVDVLNQIYNIAVGDRTSLNDLHQIITNEIKKCRNIRDLNPVYRDFRDGDVLHSQADISKAQKLLGYRPTHNIRSGIQSSISWYLKHNQ